MIWKYCQTLFHLKFNSWYCTWDLLTGFNAERLIHVVSSYVNKQVLTSAVGSVCNAGWVEFIHTLYIAESPSLNILSVWLYWYYKLASAIKLYQLVRGNAFHLLCRSECSYLFTPFPLWVRNLTAVLNQSSSYHLNAGWTYCVYVEYK